MDVVVYAVDMSPQGMAIANRSPLPKLIVLVSEPGGMVLIFSLSLIREPFEMFSTTVFAVPALGVLRPSNPSSSSMASGISCLSFNAKQSVGTTSKPAPGQIIIFASFACLSRSFACSKTYTSPVMSR